MGAPIISLSQVEKVDKFLNSQQYHTSRWSIKCTEVCLTRSFFFKLGKAKKSRTAFTHFELDTMTDVFGSSS